MQRDSVLPAYHSSDRPGQQAGDRYLGRAYCKFQYVLYKTQSGVFLSPRKDNFRTPFTRLCLLRKSIEENAPKTKHLSENSRPN
jgi:hypothetical protein